MKQNRTYIVTGATGFLGQKLTRALVHEGSNVVLFVREKAGASSADRINDLFNFNNEEQKKVRVINCDIENMDDVYKSDDFKSIFSHKIDGIWHLAANLSFRSKDKEIVNNVNFIGTQQIAKLAKKLNTQLFYVSTAYVHGQRLGLLKEEELIRSKFNNSYEESKFATEEYLKEQKNNGLKYLVFRPAILIDVDDATASQRAPFGYYSILQLMNELVSSLRNFIHNHKFYAGILGLRLDAHGILHSYYIPFVVTKTSLNMVPIDTAVSSMLKIAEITGKEYDTFHIASPEALSMREIARVTFDELKMKIRILVIPSIVMEIIFKCIFFLSRLIPELVSLSKKLHQYGYYMTNTYHFDTIQTEQIYGNHEYTKLFSNETEDLRCAARVFISKQESLKAKTL